MLTDNVLHSGNDWRAWTVRGVVSVLLMAAAAARRAELVPSREIWWRSALPWTSDLNLPGAERLDRQ